MKAPDTLTSWTGEAICMGKHTGIGLAKPASILVKKVWAFEVMFEKEENLQDFFADLRLPYSVKRGESFPLNVTFFNNLDVSFFTFKSARTYQLPIGTGDGTKMDEFSEKFQTDFDPPSSFSENYVANSL